MIDNYGRTALSIAVGKGQKDTVKLLLKRGADPKKGPTYHIIDLHDTREKGANRWCSRRRPR